MENRNEINKEMSGQGLKISRRKDVGAKRKE